MNNILFYKIVEAIKERYPDLAELDPSKYAEILPWTNLDHTRYIGEIHFGPSYEFTVFEQLGNPVVKIKLRDTDEHFLLSI